ncbi:hypothetical protein NLG97_g1626 [Lecanicillium saksenae]|uniref:Uncharacterized protein n=1 Tax=Lecanicillium saksenae TaxID=468837 RepID=A0ACC1R387_9HYPO|nr:hypothetical protein NLG97_g1626 [Lecanicillium saksenae]
MGQQVSATTSCVQMGGPYPSPVSNCLPLDLQNRFKEISKAIIGEEVTQVVIKVAERGPPSPKKYPHDTTKDTFTYNYMSPSWWTSGFFPGSLWLLYERSLKVHGSVPSQKIVDLALQWQKGLESQQHNTGTHDLGFMMLPAFYKDFKLRGSNNSREIIATSAQSLSSRWSETVQCLRSWDSMSTPKHDWNDKNANFLVIIDNMMNLELLYRGAEITGNKEFARRATQHAKTTLKHHIRPDDSTYHLVDYDPKTGDVIGRFTVQGYADNSTWARGQSWGLYAYTMAYRMTNDPAFLDAANRLGTYFTKRVEETAGGTGMVLWDFDAPQTQPPIRDMSAAMVACSGLLELYSLTNDKQFMPAVATILEYATEHARAPKGSDTILRGATVNNNPDVTNRNFETGLVYADYYLLEVGNRLIELGLN